VKIKDEKMKVSWQLSILLHPFERQSTHPTNASLKNQR
jgi:hypothetical protein